MLRGFRPQRQVYKGYGLFQYDLQHVIRDRAFSRKSAGATSMIA